ncbi:MAG: hypothetical protein B7X95_05575 [Methylophilaceae bacterium 17-44-8]|nr:MAG: hypothetical protein B7Y48_01630 [Methylophilales bacterium 28-44-11]OZA05669.1 MAG: hypothetical protein B7X95_05575 [Methylophilaceae bacterium 17-44-8]
MSGEPNRTPIFKHNTHRVSINLCVSSHNTLENAFKLICIKLFLLNKVVNQFAPLSPYVESMKIKNVLSLGIVDRRAELTQLL